MVIWDATFMIGVLLIVSGFLMVQHQIVTAKADKEARSSGDEIICGNAKGFLCLSSSYIWIRSDSAGNLGNAWVVRSSIAAPAKAYTYDLHGNNIRTIELAKQSNFPCFASNACRAAQANYLRLAACQNKHAGACGRRKTEFDKKNMGRS